ncbi:LLM class flavin-dependent oxidoreductase [Halosolutus amylolyticus]|uniref:LLM class flavin-dependent oxidoreductase n=1 Tax=Halosolutus amylolyticus TaxID=2932267 RepID=A0ABD5PII0_9EURY|nr:LLM class flavin-dependent oxidoreductase [Halosolutus amylolyticus]
MAPSVGLFPRSTTHTSLVDFAVRAEALGYTSVWIGEGVEHNLFVKLSEIATQTSSITLGSGIANVYTRTPTLLAMSAMSLQRQSGGRFILGLGASHPPIVEDYHGLAFDRPLQRLEETVDIIKALTSDDDSTEYDGDIFSVCDLPCREVQVPLYNAAIGPANRRLTGQLFDGWIPYGIPLPALESATTEIESGRESIGRCPDSIEIVPWITAAVSDDRKTAYDAVRQHITTFVSRFDAYRRAFAQQYPEVIDDLTTAIAAGNDSDAIAHITDEMVATFAIAGEPKSAREQVRAVFDREYIDSVVLTTPRTASDGVIEQTISELAPSTL